MQVIYARAAEVERQWTLLEEVNAAACRESNINKALASLICARADASRRATERLLGVLQVMFSTRLVPFIMRPSHCTAYAGQAHTCYAHGIGVQEGLQHLGRFLFKSGFVFV